MSSFFWLGLEPDIIVSVTSYSVIHEIYLTSLKEFNRTSVTGYGECDEV